jgi:lipid A 3-O-deacylase
MSHISARGAWANTILGSAAAAVIFGLASMPAAAQPPEELEPFFAISEVRLGGFAANLEDGGSEDATALVNAELLFQPLGRGRDYGNAFLDVFLNPRPHLGTSISVDEGGTNQVYGGLTWEVRLTDWAFVEASFGGTIHDGPTDGNDPDSYGCATLFRESASLGFDLSERLRLLFTVDHMSNAGLCDQNQGLTNAGVRLGYRW